MQEIPIAAIRPNSYQPRTQFDEEGLDSLTASIRLLGVLQPILVRADGDRSYELIAGERRWRAARRAGLTEIPAIVRKVDDGTSLEHALVENLHRQDLNPIEEAAAYQQLIDEFHLTHDEVARRVGKSRTAITNTLRLAQLSPSIQRMVLDGQLAAGHARALLGTPDRGYQEALARKTVTEGLSVRAVEDAVRLRSEAATSKTRKSASSATDRPAGLLELEQLLSDRLATRVRVELGPKKGRMVIEFADIEDLERVYRAMSPGS